MLLECAKGIAAGIGADLAMLTFDPHPSAFFKAMGDRTMLMTRAQKIRGAEELGVTWFLEEVFSSQLARALPHEFVADYLVGPAGSGLVGIVVGANFRFGQGRAGDAGALKDLCRQHGVACEVVASVECNGAVASSSRTREALQVGDVELASRLLGRPYCLEGVVAHGEGRGRTIGVPTANLGGVCQLLPKAGVYAGRVWVASEGGSPSWHPPVTKRWVGAWPAVFNIGVSPTFGPAISGVRVEGHVLDRPVAQDEFYGRPAAFALEVRLRDERKFASAVDLKAAIAEDIRCARDCLLSES